MGSIDLPERQVYDVLIIGAGISGICTLHHLTQRLPNWRIKLLDNASGPGGVWCWNRYPGARFDSESVSYSYSWDKELLNEWDWKETFSAQPETLKYFERVCEKHDLYRFMQFDTRVKTARWQEHNHRWLFQDDRGTEYESIFFVSCLGFLSTPTLPNIPGIENFQGKCFHTSRWPADVDAEHDFEGKNIGVIGTGATGIQVITTLSKNPKIKSLAVFQRTANWSAPLRNTAITPEQMVNIKSEYDATFQRCADSPTSFLHYADPRRSLDVTPEERLAHFEKIYGQPGFSKWLGVFKDTYTDREANRLYSDFMTAKIRARVHDPIVAQKLIPKHGYGMRRVPMESGYFEAFNQPHVHLVDVSETPITATTPTAFVTSDGHHHDIDILICATGFDAITGAFSAIDWHGAHDRPLMGDSTTEKGARAIWADDRPRTFLGLTVPSMPNMFIVAGPHQPLGNATRTIEHAVNVVTALLTYCHDKAYTRVEPTEDAVQAWTDHVYECSKGLLLNEVDSWMTGVNTNVEGKTMRRVVRYAGNTIEYRRMCWDCRDRGWPELMFE